MLHPEPLPLWQATPDTCICRRHSNTVLDQSLCGLWVLVCTRFVWILQVSLVGMGLNSKLDFAPPTVLLGLLLCSWACSVFLVGSNILLWTVVQQQVVILDFSHEKMSTYPSTPPSSSTIFERSNSGFVKIGPFCLCNRCCNSITDLSTQISLLCSWPALMKIDLITPSLQQNPAFSLGSYFLVPLCSQLSSQIYFSLQCFWKHISNSSTDCLILYTFAP